jgi:hypothetical protein
MEFAGEVRFSEWKNGKRHQRTRVFDPIVYPSKKDVRQALELTVSQVNAGADAPQADAKFMDVCALYRQEHLPTLEHSTRYTNAYLLDDYIEAHFGHTPIRNVKPLEIDRWLTSLKLAATTKAAIRSIMSVCFNLAALHEYIPPMQRNPMSLIKLKSVSKRQKKVPELTFFFMGAIVYGAMQKTIRASQQTAWRTVSTFTEMTRGTPKSTPWVVTATDQALILAARNVARDLEAEAAGELPVAWRHGGVLAADGAEGHCRALLQRRLAGGACAPARCA